MDRRFGGGAKVVMDQRLGGKNWDGLELLGHLSKFGEEGRLIFSGVGFCASCMFQTSSRFKKL